MAVLAPSQVVDVKRSGPEVVVEAVEKVDLVVVDVMGPDFLLVQHHCLFQKFKVRQPSIYKHQVFNSKGLTYESERKKVFWPAIGELARATYYLSLELPLKHLRHEGDLFIRKRHASQILKR